MRLLAFYLAVSLVLAMFHKVAADYTFTQTVRSKDATIRFVLNWQAYEQNPWDTNIRRQLPLSLTAILMNTDSTVTKEAAWTIHKIGMSAAPHLPTTQLARIEYLLNSREDDAELETRLGFLKRVHPHAAETWLADALTALLKLDIGRACEAADRGLKVTRRRGYEKQFKMVKEAFDCHGATTTIR